MAFSIGQQNTVCEMGCTEKLDNFSNNTRGKFCRRWTCGATSPANEYFTFTVSNIFRTLHGQRSVKLEREVQKSIIFIQHAVNTNFIEKISHSKTQNNTWWIYTHIHINYFVYRSSLFLNTKGILFCSQMFSVVMLKMSLFHTSRTLYRS